MDIEKEFQAYLPEWAEKHCQPVPTLSHKDRWSVAWKDFLNDRIVPRKKEIISEYKSMQFKTVGDLEDSQDNATTEEFITHSAENVETSSAEEVKPIENEDSWERVLRMMNTDDLLD